MTASKKKLTIYSFNARFKDYANVRHVGLNKKAVEEARLALILQGRHTIGELKTEEHYSILYQAPFGTPLINFIDSGAVKVGERHVEVRCTGLRSFYSIPEFLDEAKKSFEKQEKGQSISADRYYSQVWV